MLNFEGVISSGLQKAGDFIKLDVYKSQYEEKLGFMPFAGTLNIKLKDDIEIDIENEHSGNLQKIDGNDDYGDVFFLFAQITDLKNNITKSGAILFPIKSVYTTNTLEFVCEDNLRQCMDLEDDDEVILEIKN
ncbi:MAG: DUF120 domain-containing protein [Methanosphaera sp.]|uniref:CTP-dependent riboflavin kinase n=1 Tax=Methanosphaera sp. TaxID=2666342 RepID=UPI0025CF2670|nr:CTP-dependent riboflavin kinase [Methanosphaera sp.]MCI5867590.1 CTP-dependent riboflavin kinase [Methanosphaera sp.]MDD6534057.1 CTP-dependent riboflavin kinase [Methanosphaera sp.]MDY3956133.1 DUF120 domain-containing protein [Methanosphaera sp.]